MYRQSAGMVPSVLHSCQKAEISTGVSSSLALTRFFFITSLNASFVSIL